MTAPETRAQILEERDGRRVDIFERNAESGGYQKADRGPAAASYLVCFEERSGSTMLCSMLGQTGVMGNPDEFLNPRGPMQMYLVRSQARDMAEYYAYLHNELVTVNEVFGMKTTFADLAPLLEGDAFAALLGQPRYVYLTRADIVRQAVSSALARKRSVWHAYAGRDTRPTADEGLEVDVPLVMRIISRIREQRRSWEEFFGVRRLSPLRITYEDMAADPRATLRGLARFVGVDLADEQIPAASQTLQLSNETNEAWVAAVRARIDA